MILDLPQYKQAAWQLFKELTANADNQNCSADNNSIFSYCNYWQVGNVADTLIDYMKMSIQETDPRYRLSPLQAQHLVEAIYQKYLTMAGCWYDDYGWWGIAAAKAYDPAYAQVFGPHTAIFKSVALDCWNVLQNGRKNGPYHGAPFVWEYCDKRYFAGVAPKFEGAVWQYEIAACPIPRDCSFSNNAPTPIDVNSGPDNCGIQYKVDLGPFQLSVVNGLYLVLATRLAGVNAIAKAFAINVYSFIDKWCNVETGANTSLLNTYGSVNYGLIRERVSEYANGAQVNCYYSDNAWAGDQGLFMGGLLDFATLFNAPAALLLARKITFGVQQQMEVVPVSSGGNIFASYLPYANPNPPFTGDFDDYTSGLGVLLRYLAYVYQTSPQIAKIVNAPDYRTAIINTANAAATDSIPRSGVKIFAAFNRLAALMMGIVLK